MLDSPEQKPPWWPWNPEMVYDQYFHDPHDYARENVSQALTDLHGLLEEQTLPPQVSGVLRGMGMEIHNALTALDHPVAFKAAWHEGFRRDHGAEQDMDLHPVPAQDLAAHPDFPTLPVWGDREHDAYFLEPGWRCRCVENPDAAFLSWYHPDRLAQCPRCGARAADSVKLTPMPPKEKS
jgi:hypothetical protein